MNITPTIDVVELLVLVLGIGGLIVSLIMIALILGDRIIIRIAKTNGINKRLTNADLRNELSRAYKLVGFTAAAILSMTIPPPVTEEVRQAGEWFKWMLISWEVVAVVNSVWSFVDRAQNRDELKEIEAAKKLAAFKLLEARAAAEHGIALNTANAATNVADAALNVTDAAANASTAAANASDAAANAEDSLANSANAATNAARSEAITKQESAGK